MSRVFLPSCKLHYSLTFHSSVHQNSKLQVLFLRANNLQDDDVKQICQVLKPDPLNPLSQKPLKVLDLSYNPITHTAVQSIADMLDINRTLEYIGLAKCKL